MDAEPCTLVTSGAVARRSCASLAAINNDALLLFGGIGPSAYYNDLHMFHIPSTSWSEVYPLGAKPDPRGGCASTFMRDQNLWVLFGGRRESGCCSDLYSLDVGRLVWTALHGAPGAQVPPPREDGLLCCNGTGGVLLIGGSGVDGALADCWRFDTRRLQWDLLSPCIEPFPNGVAAAASAQTESQVYIFGGYDRHGTFLGELWSLSLEPANALTWRQVEIRGSVPKPRTHALMTLCDGALLVCGGYGEDGAVGDVWQLSSVSTDLRNAAAPLLVVGEERSQSVVAVGTSLVRGAAAAAVARRCWFIFGGCDGAAFLQDTVRLPLNRLQRSVAPPQRSTSTHSHQLQHAPPHPYHHTPVQPTLRSASDAPSDRPPSHRPAAPRHSDVGSLTDAIASLKLEIFGPRVTNVDTLIEENRKLREENARLQQTVLDLMRRLSSGM